MVITLLADANIVGHVERLASLMQSPYWREIWNDLDIRLATFTDVGLVSSDPDAVVWRRCQHHQLLLVTSNRNADDPDSLEATIRTEGTPTSLPVFTLGDSEAVLRDHEYADRVAAKLFDYLWRLDTLRGTGRLYLP
jgi:hypothetical protein